MSLSLAIEQIQRRSFWCDFKAADKTPRNAKERAAEERRDAVIRIIRLIGGRASVSEIQNELDCSMASVRNITGKMVTDGRIIRSGLKNNSVAYEVAP